MSQSDYGAGGIIGMLTPQANTTVEPEFWALMPTDWSMLNARLTSDKSTIEERLVDYTTRFVHTAEDFANAPVDVIGIGCTGASYLIGRDQEQKLMAEISERHNKRCYTAAAATILALNAISAKKIALLSPYPDSLNEKCVPYWESFGFEVVAVTGPKLVESRFHPIYAMTGAATLASMDALKDTDCDAIVMLGTGMPTLLPLIARAGWNGPVPISCNLALAWACVEPQRGRSLDASTLAVWISAEEWGPRFKALFPAAAD
ncbi:MAG: maleate cis-trans isomerase family protein [Sulfitobacter geojensis]